jgi:hypothetical protein
MYILSLLVCNQHVGRAKFEVETLCDLRRMTNDGSGTGLVQPVIQKLVWSEKVNNGNLVNSDSGQKSKLRVALNSDVRQKQSN